MRWVSGFWQALKAWAAPTRRVAVVVEGDTPTSLPRLDLVLLTEGVSHGQRSCFAPAAVVRLSSSRFCPRLSRGGVWRSTPRGCRHYVLRSG